MHEPACASDVSALAIQKLLYQASPHASPKLPLTFRPLPTSPQRAVCPSLCMNIPYMHPLSPRDLCTSASQSLSASIVLAACLSSSSYQTQHASPGEMRSNDSCRKSWAGPPPHTHHSTSMKAVPRDVQLHGPEVRACEAGPGPLETIEPRHFFCRPDPGFAAPTNFPSSKSRDGSRPSKPLPVYSTQRRGEDSALPAPPKFWRGHVLVMSLFPVYEPVVDIKKPQVMIILSQRRSRL